MCYSSYFFCFPRVHKINGRWCLCDIYPFLKNWKLLSICTADLIAFLFLPWRGETSGWWHCAVLLRAALLERVVYTPFPLHPFTLEPTWIRLSNPLSTETAIVKVTSNLHMAKYNSQFPVLRVFDQHTVINLSFWKRFFDLASRTRGSGLLLHYWQFHCRLFSWFIRTSKIWSPPGVRLLGFPMFFLVITPDYDFSWSLFGNNFLKAYSLSLWLIKLLFSSFLDENSISPLKKMSDFTRLFALTNEIGYKLCWSPLQALWANAWFIMCFSSAMRQEMC